MTEDGERGLAAVDRDESRSSSESRDEAKAGSGSDSASTNDPVAAPKLSRKSSSKLAYRSPTLFTDLPDVTEQSCASFQVINDCLYGSKHMGASENDALDCDCDEDWHDGQNNACGEDSDCINRVTKMECVDGDCKCGKGCQNQRFQRKEYADVSVIKTEKKGFGLRANADLHPNDFVFEYIGEVINEPTFRRRMMQYDEEGIKHFYFMSLTKSEFVDATKKGNLGRFCNHSCNPNCYVDKWVVRNKLRMGIFALRKINAGEELVFNYNVDRYGADPQPCYCGEPNCTGFIGGKTQTERATKLPVATLEALGIDDGEGWDTTVAKKPRKKKPSEDDEEYVNSVQPRPLDEAGVTKIMAALMQGKEKWIAVKLLSRIQSCAEDRVMHRVLQLHGYQIFKTTLTSWIDDDNVVLQVLDILYKLPRISKNKISDSNIEATVEGLTASDHEEVAGESKRLLDEWSKLKTEYRIPKGPKGKKHDHGAQATNSFDDRRGAGREEEVTPKPKSPMRNIVIPKGPKSNIPQRSSNFSRQQRPPHFGLPAKGELPAGWSAARDQHGRVYYFQSADMSIRTWQRPAAPALPRSAPKVQAQNSVLDDIIASITKESTPKASASQTPKQADTPVQEPKKEKWRSQPIEKQMKIYEITLSPHVQHVVNKFRHQLPKEVLKKLAKEVSKKLVASDYKNKRVDDPNVITSKTEKQVKKYVLAFFERAVKKYEDHEKTKKADRAARHVARDSKAAELAKADATPNSAPDTPSKEIDGLVADVMTEDEMVPSPSSSERKRKREEDKEGSASQTPSERSVKRLKEEDGSEAPSPPPSPPPPPEDEMNAEDQAMQEQEAALMRENEEAQRLAEEEERIEMRKQEEALERENAEAMRDFEIYQNNGTSVKPDHVDGHANGLGLDARMEIDGDDTPNMNETERRKQEVLSH